MFKEIMPEKCFQIKKKKNRIRHESLGCKNVKS